MIKVTDLISWAKLNAVESSLACPAGWIRGADLEKLTRAVRKSEPFAYAPVRRGVHEADGDGTTRL